MQPYLFPYLGYFQLMHAVDTFVFFDDVNFITKGWIHRNQLLDQGAPLKFTVPLKKISQNRLISETEMSNFEEWKIQFIKTVESLYKKAPFFNNVFTWLQNLLANTRTNHISDLACSSAESIASMLSLNTNFKRSGNLSYQTGERMDGQKKIISICKTFQASTYINAKNGEALYDRQEFLKNNLNLYFIQMKETRYSQFDKDSFVPNLSIIDILMFNSIDEAKRLVTNYSLS